MSVKRGSLSRGVKFFLFLGGEVGGVRSFIFLFYSTSIGGGEEGSSFFPSPFRGRGVLAWGEMDGGVCLKEGFCGLASGSTDLSA